MVRRQLFDSHLPGGPNEHGCRHTPQLDARSCNHLPLGRVEGDVGETEDLNRVLQDDFDTSQCTLARLERFFICNPAGDAKAVHSLTHCKLVLHLHVFDFKRSCTFAPRYRRRSEFREGGAEELDERAPISCQTLTDARGTEHVGHGLGEACLGCMALHRVGTQCRNLIDRDRHAILESVVREKFVVQLVLLHLAQAIIDAV
mmetsp:Transcript_8611/g.18729  ORF Transcript_8611/g.18729 Transcript_8611/m.18729 type:complete len:202 (+) Transcript_8611:347-952(+)